MKKLWFLILGLMMIAGTAQAVSIFNSGQVGTNASNGYVLQTNGSTSTWVATSSLGFGTGGSSSGTINSGVVGQIAIYNASNSIIGYASGTYNSSTDQWALTNLSLVNQTTTGQSVFTSAGSPTVPLLQFNTAGKKGGFYVGANAPLYIWNQGEGSNQDSFGTPLNGYGFYFNPAFPLVWCTTGNLNQGFGSLGCDTDLSRISTNTLAIGITNSVGNASGSLKLLGLNASNNVTTTNLTISGLGSGSSPCLVVSATGVVSTSTCGTGAGGSFSATGTPGEVLIFTATSTGLGYNGLQFDGTSTLTIGGAGTTTLKGDGTQSTFGGSIAVPTGVYPNPGGVGFQLFSRNPANGVHVDIGTGNNGTVNIQQNSSANGELDIALANGIHLSTIGSDTGAGGTSYYGTIKGDNLTGNNTYQLPNFGGTFALTNATQTFSGTVINGQATTTQLAITGLGSTGSPCLVVGSGGAVTTSTCSAGGSGSTTLITALAPLVVSQSGSNATLTFNTSTPLTLTGLYTFNNGVISNGNVTTTNETVSSTLNINNLTPSGTVTYPISVDGSSFLNIGPVIGNSPGSGATTTQEYNIIKQNCPVNASTSNQGECTFSQSLTTPYGLTGRVFYDHTLELYAPTFLWGDFISATQSSTLPEYVVEFTDHTNNHAQPFTITPINSSTNNGFTVGIGNSGSVTNVTGNLNVVGNVVATGSVNVYSAGNGSLNVFRASSTNFSDICIGTANTTNWCFQQSNNSTNNGFLLDPQNGGNILAFIPNGATTIGNSGSGVGITAATAFTASTTLAVNNTSTLSGNLIVTPLGSTGSPCVDVSSVGQLATTTCGTGGSGATTTIVASGTTLNGPAFTFASTSAIQPYTSGTALYWNLNTSGNWSGTWQGVNTSSFYLASNPSGYISAAITSINGDTTAAQKITVSGGLLTSSTIAGVTTIGLTSAAVAPSTTIPTNTNQLTNGAGFITGAPATTTIKVSTTTLTGPAFVLSTSTSAGTWNIAASGTNQFVFTIPPAGDAFYAPSTTIPTSYVSSVNSQTGAVVLTTAATTSNSFSFTTSGGGPTITLNIPPFITTSSVNINGVEGRVFTNLATDTSGGTCTNCNITFNANGLPTSIANGSAGGGGGITTSSLGNFTPGNIPIFINTSTVTATSGLSVVSSTGELQDTFVKSALELADGSGNFTAYGGSSTCNGGITTISAVGVATCGQFGNVSVTAANTIANQVPYWTTSASGTLNATSVLSILPNLGINVTGTAQFTATTTVGTGSQYQFTVNPATTKTYVQVGSSTVSATVGGTMAYSATSTGNGAGASTTLETFNIPTSTYLTNGDEVDITMGGTIANTSASNKILQLLVASTSIFTSTQGASLFPPNQACNWFLESKGVLTAPTTTLWATQFTDSCNATSTDDSGDAGNQLVTVTSTAPINITLFGNGTNASDTIANYARYLYNPF